MTKKQKIWLWVSLGIFVIPEIVWSPIVSLFYSFAQNSNNAQLLRSSFLYHPDNRNILTSILFLQFLGLLLTTILLIKLNLKLKKPILWLLIVFLFILTIITFFLFGFSVAFNGIG
ncbi:MAG: hypothetical protein A3B10_04250 [Candidatus Doudnabacteria bacterium RIFCSPLOWO2_01_FULL_44_21]|uniref:Uncharacterized protein n=1 Tax=Candidatus Doudnabacteria bacterium RIFCSPLOWO2_01_FULL_44_21 TaxID=1817841 RepID=A0A1F5PXT2_9BACT|nr:MAG: hypothetical protein A3B10_04250 [Candidatus Doudnabacteria bacterium RIFCSPLOWO2_01_FULL_44_21]